MNEKARITRPAAGWGGKANDPLTHDERSGVDQGLALTDGTRGMRIGRSGRRLTRLLTGNHRRVLQVTGSRLLGRMGGHPLLILTTSGRLSGRPRSTPVIGIPDGQDWLLVASNGGAATHPLWVRNISEHPRVTIRRGELRRAFDATILSREERAQVWPDLVKAYHPYGTMQAKTDRQLSVVRLRPVTGE